MEWLRDANWLTRDRVRGYALLLCLAGLGSVVYAFTEAMGPVGTDFLAFWGAGHVTVAGDPGAAYDLAVQEQLQTATGSDGWFAFVNPPPFLFAVAPFGALPLPMAWIAWVAVTWALWAWASLRAFPRLGPLVIAYPGAVMAAMHAQTGLLTGALLVFAAYQLDRRPTLSGAAIGALVIKPHLAVLAPLWFAAGRRWRAFVVAGCVALALIAASVLVFGQDILAKYATSWRASEALLVGIDRDFLLRMSTFFSQTRLIAGDVSAAFAGGVSAIVALAAATFAWRRFRGDAQATGAVVLAATALASPYLFNYDLPFLIYPTLWLVMQGLERGFRPFEKAGLAILYFAPFATRALAFPLQINLMPVAALMLLVLVWSRGGARAGTLADE